MTRWLAPICTLLVALGTAAPASAGDKRAEALFREGREAMKREDYATACAKFEESLTVEESMGPLLNLAECNEKRGKLARSLELWREGLQKMPASDGRRDLASRRVTDLEGRVPSIVIERAPVGAKLFVDGRPVTGGVPVLVDPGTHEVTVTGVDGASRTVSVDAVEGRATPFDAGGGAASSAPAASPRTDGDEADGGGSAVPAIIAFSVGGAGLVAFGITGVLWLGEKSTVDEQCPGRVCTPEGIEAGDSGQTLGIVNVIALGVGVVGAGVGGFLLWRAFSDEGPATATQVRLTGTGMRLDGRF